LEQFINDKYKTGTLKVQVSFIPLRPDQLKAALTQGVGDFIAYTVVVTQERQQKVAFTVPLRTDVQQVVVSGPSFGTVSSVEDLGGKEVYVNPLAVAYQNLQQVNEKLKKEGKPPLKMALNLHGLVAKAPECDKFVGRYRGRRKTQNCPRAYTRLHAGRDTLLSSINRS